MRRIYKIAKVELQTLFYSPIAWLLLICFVFQTASIFLRAYEMFSRGIVYNASSDIFIQQGVWIHVAEFLYFYIPLLTMGVVSRQLSSGSIKLLYSSPVSNTQIVLGKFLGMAIFGGIMMLVLVAYVIYAEITVANFEMAWILTGLLGLFLLLCTYMAIGIFVSSLTSYQVVAAVGTFIVLMLLSVVGNWGQHYDFVREITYWLGINGRTSTFIDGMICSEDLIYFPVITAFFLALTVIRLHAVRQKQKFVITLRKNLLLVTMLIAIAWLSSRPVLTTYVDTTSTQRNTLTPVSQDIISQLKGGLTITTYVNILDPLYDQFRYPGFILSNREQFRQYTRFKPETKLKVVYYWADTDNYALEDDYPGLSAWQKTRKLCEKYDVDSMMLKTKEEIDQIVDLSEEGYTFIRQIERKNGQKEWLRYFDHGGGLPGEAEISVALKRMVMSLPKVGYVTGHRERDLERDLPQGYRFALNHKQHQYAFVNQGFDVIPVSLDKTLPEDIELLLFADPRSDLSQAEDAVLKEYLERGGNLMFVGEPRHREMQNELLRRHFGLELTPLLAGDIKKYKGYLAANVIPAVAEAVLPGNMYRQYGTTVLMDGCSGIEQLEEKGYEFQSFFRVDSTGMFWTELETVDFVDDTVKFNPTIGEVSCPFTVVAGLTRQVNDKEQRIIIAGDADWFSNNEYMVSRPVGSAGDALILSAGDWLSEGRVPLDVRRPRMYDQKVKISPKGYKWLSRVFMGILPLLILAGGCYVWIRRRGR